MKKHLVAEEKFERALFCANDAMAIGVIRALKEAEINIPEEIEIAEPTILTSVDTSWM
jgi:DNA-binding LacI/PurR family transcriptional regulator